MSLTSWEWLPTDCHQAASRSLQLAGESLADSLSQPNQMRISADRTSTEDSKQCFLIQESWSIKNFANWECHRLAFHWTANERVQSITANWIPNIEMISMTAVRYLAGSIVRLGCSTRTVRCSFGRYLAFRRHTRQTLVFKQFPRSKVIYLSIRVLNLIFSWFASESKAVQLERNF